MYETMHVNSLLTNNDVVFYLFYFDKEKIILLKPLHVFYFFNIKFIKPIVKNSRNFIYLYGLIDEIKILKHANVIKLSTCSS